MNTRNLHFGTSIKVLVLVVAIAVIAAADTWRTALLALAAAGALAATRVRFVCHGAMVLLVLVALLAVNGNGISGDQRQPQAKRGGH